VIQQNGAKVRARERERERERREGERREGAAVLTGVQASQITPQQTQRAAMTFGAPHHTPTI